MEKSRLKNYNQWILAVLGSLAVLAVLLMIVAGIESKVSKWNRQKTLDEKRNDIIVELPKDTIHKKKLRLQEVTFSLPDLLDTLQETYLIPVSQINLETPEYIDDVNYDLPVTIQETKTQRYLKYRNSGNYNNMIVYNGKSQEMNLIFNNQKVLISSYQYFVSYQKQYILFIVSNSDSNNDNKLTDEDLSSFCVYDIALNKLHEFGFDNYGLIDYNVLFGKEEIILKYGIDKDNDGTISSYNEPFVLKRLLLSNYAISDFVETDIINNIQQIIDCNK